jgi:hypothetical protein
MTRESSPSPSKRSCNLLINEWDVKRIDRLQYISSSCRAIPTSYKYRVNSPSYMPHVCRAVLYLACLHRPIKFPGLLFLIVLFRNPIGCVSATNHRYEITASGSRGTHFCGDGNTIFDIQSRRLSAFVQYRKLDFRTTPTWLC